MPRAGSNALAAFAPFLFALAAGCGGSTHPPLTQAAGVVTINGRPLPNATVSFIPLDKENTAGVANGVSDDQGRFRLTTAGKPGAAVGRHKVTVTEGPEPEDLRDESKQAEYRRYQAGLKNRPIPPQYGNPTQTPLEVTLAADQPEIKVELKR